MPSRTLILAALAAGIALTAGPGRADEKPTKDIIETAATAGQFKTFAAALEKAGLVDTLKGKGPFTVFAPTDKAFAKVPKEKLDVLLADKEKLTKLLLAHVVADKVVKAVDVRKLKGEMVNGFKIDTTDGVKIGDAKVIKADIPAANGVIHVIDTVLIPVQ